MVDTLIFIPFIWLAHAAIACILSAPIIYFSRKRVHWQRWESLALVIPFAIFSLLMLSHFVTKNALNMFDAITIGFAVPIAALVRVIVGVRIEEEFTSGALMFFLCVIAFVVYFSTPIVRDSM
jgi:hypothetical protein